MNIHARNCPKRDISKFIDLNKIHPYNSLSVVSMKVSLVNQTILLKTEQIEVSKFLSKV